MSVRSPFAWHLPRPATSALLAGVLLATASLSACAEAIPGRAIAADVAAAPTTGAVEVPTDTPDPAAATTWINTVCGSLVTLSHSTDRRPDVDVSSDAAFAAGVVTYLDGLEDAVDTASSDLEADRPSPLARGDAFITKLTDGLSVVRSALEQTKANLRRHTPHSRAALEKAIEPLATIHDELVPMDQLRDTDAETDAAAADAPNCQQLKRLVDADDGFALPGI